MLIFIATLTNVIWLTIPYFQRGSKYVYFFGITGIAGLYQIISFYILHLPSSPIYITYSFLLIPSIYYDFFKKHLLILIVGGVAAFAALYQIDGHLQQVFSLCAHIIVLFLLGATTTIQTLKSGKLNIYLIVLVTYEVSMVVKLIPIVKADLNSVPLFVITTIIQIIIGLFFIFIKENNKKFILSI